MSKYTEVDERRIESERLKKRALEHTEIDPFTKYPTLTKEGRKLLQESDEIADRTLEQIRKRNRR